MTINIDALLAAATLVDDLEGQRQREHDAFTLGFRLGHDHGYGIGHRHGQNEITREMEQDWAAMKHLLRGPTPVELERRRAEVGSLCLAFRERFCGGNEYTGGPVPGIAEDWERWATQHQQREQPQTCRQWAPLPEGRAV